MGKLGIVSNSIVYIYGEYTYSQNTAKNQTTLTTKVILTCYGGGAGYDTFNGGVQIGGNFYSGSAININLAAAGTYVLYSRTDTFTHNDDGSFPSGWGLQFNCGNAGAYSYSSHIYLHSVIPKIPRISSITNTTSTSNRLEFGNSVDFEISRFSNSYTHDLTFKVDGTTYTIGTDLDTSASYIFGIDLIEKFINTDVPTITVTCTTKNGDTTIGTSNTTVYLSVPSSYVPTCSLVLSDAGSVPSEWGVYVKTKSKIKGIITAIGSAGSTISNYNSTANNQTFTTQEFTTSELTSTGEMVVNSTVTDSRGRQASDSKTVNVIDYWTPSISTYSIARCDADGTLNEDGTYGKVIVKYSIAPIENHNTKSLVVKYGDVTKTFTLENYNGTYESTEYFTDLATNSSHVFEIYICDYFNSDIKFTFTMTPSYCTISKLAGGKGVTFGQVAIEEGFNCYMDADFKNALTKNGKEVALKEDVEKIYSTTETKTNKVWIDGKPIYRKTFTSTTNEQNFNIAHGVSIDTVVAIDGYYRMWNTTWFRLGCTYYLGNIEYLTALRISGDNIEVSLGGWINRNSDMITHVTIEYTKTTD